MNFFYYAIVFICISATLVPQSARASLFFNLLEGKKTVECNVALSGGSLSGEVQSDDKSVQLETDNDSNQSGSIELKLTSESKQKFDLELIRSGELNISTTIKGTEVKFYGTDSAVISLRRHGYLSIVTCYVK